MRNFETAISRCHVRMNCFCISSFLASGEGQILSTRWPEKKVQFFLLFFISDAVGNRGVGRTSRNLQRRFTRLFLPLQTGNKTRSTPEDKNLPKYPVRATLNKTVTFLCIHIMLFAGKLTLNSYVFFLEG